MYHVFYYVFEKRKWKYHVFYYVFVREREDYNVFYDIKNEKHEGYHVFYDILEDSPTKEYLKKGTSKNLPRDPGVKFGDLSPDSTIYD